MAGCGCLKSIPKNCRRIDPLPYRFYLPWRFPALYATLPHVSTTDTLDHRPFDQTDR